MGDKDGPNLPICSRFDMSFRTLSFTLSRAFDLNFWDQWAFSEFKQWLKDH
jgi:hypothetical protein